ncbi:YHYH domain-containing protein [Metabacillus sp. KIGAM252]|uniref:YHYH domain-containing protein n=1 Tax=Metabacillus flavus TaxID=2823519 RepID=A0ABS5LIJ7_9BACI|nr:YHYH domain-containing protein [Metabacillus flavus]MBS2970543.1 YHYH domain-containing protein [Metabacillus flavus]
MKFRAHILILFSLFLISYSSTDVSAHSGRTNSSGCHNNRSTGGYHCHGGYGDTTSNGRSTVESYKDSDLNGVNDSYQDLQEIGINIENMGFKDGEQDAEYGSFQENPKTPGELSNAEYGWYKEGYKKGYKTKIDGIAYEQGYQKGLGFKSTITPEKFAITSKAKAKFNSGYLKGQTEKWIYTAKLAASESKPLSLPKDLPKDVTNLAKDAYEKSLSNIKKEEEAYQEGLSSARKEEDYSVPTKYEGLSALYYQKGYYTIFNQLINIKNTALKEGWSGEKYKVPSAAEEYNLQYIYQKYYEEGKRKKIIDKIYKVGMIFLILACILFIVFITYKIRKK